MKNRLSDELTMLTSRLMMCTSKREIINLSGEFGRLIEKVIEEESHTPTRNEKSVTATIKFTKEEVANMAKTFKKEFIANGLVARVIKRESGKRTFVYEIRYRRNGYNISASSTDLAEAKQKFLDMTKPENIDQYRVGTVKTEKDSFVSVANDWLISKKGDIDDRTWRDYKMNCEKRIFPILGSRHISTIQTNDIKSIINVAKGRVIETLQTIFKGVMLYALSNGKITYNPMDAIVFKKVARKKRRALTKEEQQKFFKRIELPEYLEYKRLLLLEYYFGLRPVELTDAWFEGNFLIALNAKHKDENSERVYKKIPVPPQAKERIDTFSPIVVDCSLDTLNRKFKQIMEDKNATQYFLRHTFCTTCQQYVRSDIVEVWMGDSSEKLIGRVYTHLPDDFMYEQMQNVKFEG